MKKRLITSLGLFTILLVDASAQVIFNWQDPIHSFFQYQCEIIAENEVELQYKKFDPWGSVTIPSNIYYKGINYNVTSLRYTFRGGNLDSVVIPNTVKSIGEEAFYDCKRLNNIIIPSSVTKIGKSAFSGAGLRDIMIPNTVVSIEEGAFHGCQLRKVTIPNSVTYMGKGAFGQNKNLKDVIIPNSVTEIPENAFIFCESLENISIPNTIRSIGRDAFMGCKSLRKIVIPSSVTSIEREAFKYCDMLAEVEGLHSAMDIDVSAFNGIPFNFEEVKESFDFNAKGFVITKLKEWQKKRDFETTVQYQTRVTKENQERKIQELMKVAIKDYTTKNKIKVTLGDYDADYQIFALNSNYGKKYVKIPQTQAPVFKKSFAKATFNATYVVTDDGLKVDDLTVILNGKKYKAEKTVYETASNNINIELPIEISGSSVSPASPTNPLIAIDHSIDQNIPVNTANNSKTFAVIIGNEKYGKVVQVPYANNDARTLAEYCKKTLGLPTQNIRTYLNATYGTILSAISDIKQIAEAYSGNINLVFYYAGHGIPNESTKDAYLLPVDADGQQTEACYPLSRLYKELGALKAKNVVVFIDACFSGAQRGEGMLASARGVALKAKAETPQGNMVVFSAASGDETAYPYKEKGHGLFTYFLLKKLQESKGECTLGELGEYIQTNVRQQSVVANRKSQTPTVTPSQGVADTWKTMKLK